MTRRSARARRALGVGRRAVEGARKQMKSDILMRFIKLSFKRILCRRTARSCAYQRRRARRDGHARRWAPEPTAAMQHGSTTPPPMPPTASARRPMSRCFPCDADHGAVGTDDGQRLLLGPTRDLQTETALATPSRGTAMPTFGSPKFPRTSSTCRVCGASAATLAAIL